MKELDYNVNRTKATIYVYFNGYFLFSEYLNTRKKIMDKIHELGTLFRGLPVYIDVRYVYVHEKAVNEVLTK